MSSNKVKIGGTLGTLGTVSGNPPDRGQELYLVEESLMSFGVSSPDLFVSSSLPTAALKPIPVGVPVSVSALLPPVGATKLKSVSNDLEYETPAKLRWKIQTVDFKPGTENPFVSITSTTEYARPSTTSTDFGGSYEIVGGDLTSQDLTIIPWPEQGNDLDESVASTQLRGFKISLDITVLLRNVSHTTFTFNKSLYGIVDSWASVFNSATLTIPMVPREITANKPDPLAPLRDLLEIQVNNRYPEVGETTNILVKPQTKIRRYRSSSPASITSSSGAAGGTIRVGGSGGTLPIEVGGVVVHDNGPTTFGTLPSILGTSQVGSFNSNLGGSQDDFHQEAVQIGSLNTIANLDPNDLTITTTGPAAWVQKFSTGLGASILPVPSLVPEGPELLRTAITITIKASIKFRVPGRKSTLNAIVKFPDTLIYPPTIKVPQVALFFRDPVDTTEDIRNSLNEILISMDPAGRTDRPDLAYLRASVDFMNERIQYFLQFYPKKNYIGTTKNTEINTLLNLLNTSKQIIDCLDRPRARLIYAAPDTPAVIGTSETIDLSTSNNNSFKNFSRTINSFIWMGPPSPRSQYQLKLASDPAKPASDAGVLYVPIAASAVPGVVWDRTRPETTRPTDVGFATITSGAEGQVTAMNKQPERVIAIKSITWQYTAR